MDRERERMRKSEKIREQRTQNKFNRREIADTDGGKAINRRRRRVDGDRWQGTKRKRVSASCDSLACMRQIWSIFFWFFKDHPIQFLSMILLKNN